MIRLSAGTAACLGLNANRRDDLPTTAYLLSGSRCQMSCAFCLRGRNSNGGDNRLGRVTWPEFSWSAVGKALSRAGEKGIARICLQAVRQENGIAKLVEQIGILKKISDLPLSLSAWLAGKDDAEKLITAGAEKIALSLDVAAPAYYREFKGGSLSGRLNLLLECSRKFPGRLSTHLICGLGESEEELLRLAGSLLQEKITVGLFAFMPLKGTRLQDARPPDPASYRRIQAALFLLKEGTVKPEDLSFKKGRLFSLGLTSAALTAKLSGGDAFRTSGCSGCNRPYYNERPGGAIYNYHRPLAAGESAEAIRLVTASLV